jgi:antitoxin component YwqK of YwqJK toxin-antitoxin module
MKKINKNFLIVIALIFSISGKSFAQSTETLFYDENWQGVATKSEAEFYRIVKFDSNKNPIGEINDYYVTGELQAKAESAKYIDRFNDSNSIFVGKSILYYKNGKIKETLVHNSDGKIVGDNIYYYESGKIKTKATFNSFSEIIGTVKHYYENGQLSQEFPYENGAINGKGIYYSETGIKTAEIEFVDNEPKYDWYLAFDEQGNSYKYDLKTNEPYKEISNTTSNNTVNYNLTLTSEGKFKNKGDALGDILYLIPAGSTVGVYGLENGYYKVNHNGKIGYLSELYFNKNSTNQTAKQTSAPQQEKPPTKERKTFYKDGKTFQYYVYNGISVTMHLSIEKNYGKYYVALIAIENLTGSPFNFDPTKIKAILYKNGKEEFKDALSAYDYMKKVNRRQSWNAALVAFGEASAANQAGYSSSRTTSTTSGYANSYGSASGYYGNTYGSFYGSSSTYGTATTNSTTQSYNGAAAYAAQQNASNNIRNYQNQQYQIRDVLNQGYLKMNTIDNEQRIIGQVNINYENADEIQIIIPVNGDYYEFDWSNN